ncbi:hypothetical protein ES703_125072 [subsurface metagenome]
MVTEVKHQCPPHHWILGSPDHGVTHARCKFCSEEKDFHEPKHEKPDLARYFRPRRNGSRPSGFYELNKEPILMDVDELGEKEAVKKWGIPHGTWGGLKGRWGLRV